ncbi:MAG TPA: efflux RND transporter periplasmic adaptor subunit, partial [Beijerinckiaceae bacterium]|nr:efflux RND transporter periplasmic adaptor subunit [Beijerinckiaceae bacterium]
MTLLVIGLAAIALFAWKTHLIGAGPAARPTARSAAKKPAAKVPVTVATAKKADFPVYLEGLGTVQPDQSVVVRSRVDGQIDKIFIHEGQIVKQGDLLVRIDPRPYKAALDQANAKKDQDEANLANAKRDLQRYSKLAAQKFASGQQLDTQKASVQQLTAQTEADQAAIESAKIQLAYTEIRAPISGRTSFFTVDQGNIVHANDTTGILSIAEVQPIAVVFAGAEG